MSSKTRAHLDGGAQASLRAADKRLIPETRRKRCRSPKRAWARRGRETLARLSAERPVAYVRAMVRLVAVMHRRLPEPPGFDRQRARADVLQRVQELARKT